MGFWARSILENELSKGRMTPMIRIRLPGPRNRLTEVISDWGLNPLTIFRLSRCYRGTLDDLAIRKEVGFLRPRLLESWLDASGNIRGKQSNH